ncbi:MAG TPA: methyl-accepting chemotaxis protein [Myxococcaceae bacterium]|jgi:methyl-accepting chemotaxis protein
MKWSLAEALKLVRARLGIRLALWGSLLAVAPLVVMSSAAAVGARLAMTEQVHGTLIAEAQGFATVVERSVYERETSVKMWAQDPVLLGGLIYGSYDKSNELLAERLVLYPMFKGLLLLGADGNAVAASSPELLRDARAHGLFTGEGWFQSGIRGDLSVEMPEGQDRLFGGEVLLLTVPLVNREHQPLGLLAGAYNWLDVAKSARPAQRRAQARGQPSLMLTVTDQHGHALFNSTGARAPQLGDLRDGGPTGVGRVDGQVVAWAINQSDLKSVADSWVFVAALDEREAYGLIRNLLTATGGLTTALIAAAVTLAVWLARRMIQPIRALHQTVTHILRDKDLTQPVPVGTPDEIGELAGAFAEMMARLREMLHRLRMAAFAFSSAAQALHTATDDQKVAFTRQAFTLEEANTTAREIKQTSLLAAKKAESMLEAASRAGEIGKQGEASLAATLGGLGEIRGQVTSIAAQIGKLSERTQQIGTITRTVKDLADQSNMLALNAAIEAVRSGEHGKGFSIVAREIRNLADQSIRATERVKEILDDTARAIRSTAKTTDKGTERMEQELVQVRGSGETLRNLSSILQDSSEVVRQIAAAVQQQDAGFAQIFVAISDLSTLMDESLQRLSTTEEAARLVRETSEEVSQVASAYRV